ncbi:MAG: hypothetical protein WC302_02510 [Candidatus Paceibacterota bacterium]|jgi:hypothetical protein
MEKHKKAGEIDEKEGTQEERQEEKIGFDILFSLEAGSPKKLVSLNMRALKELSQIEKPEK